MIRYVPILKSKSGEVNALHHLDALSRSRTVPLIRLTTRPPAGFAANLAATWSGLPLILNGNFNSAATGVTSAFNAAFTHLGNSGVSVIPNVSPHATPQYLAAVVPLVGRYAPGLAVAAKLSDLRTIQTWITGHGWQTATTDLIVILDDVADYDPPTYQGFVAHSIATAIPSIAPWRSVTLAASAAPRDYGGLATGETLVPRLDWLLWQNVSAALPFEMDYGDYATLNPDLTDPPGVAMVNATVSVRYSIDSDWIIRKGTRTNGPGGQPMGPQYRAHAAALAANPLFGGLGGCWADSEITRIASGTGGPGNRGTWASIGVNRHICLVTDRLP